MSLAPESDAGRLLVALTNLEDAGHPYPATLAIVWAAREGWSAARFNTAFEALKEQGMIGPGRNLGPPTKGTR